jgi:hypothetical protein
MAMVLGINPIHRAVVSPCSSGEITEKSTWVIRICPMDLTVSVSSGDTLAPESDPRPAVLQIGQQLTAALSKLV